MMRNTVRVVASLLLSSASLRAGEEYLFVDRASGATNGPFKIQPHAEIKLEGKIYTVQSAAKPFDFESKIIASVSYSNVPVRVVLNDALIACSISNDSSKAVVLFGAEKVDKRVTIVARGIKLGELLRVVCEYCDLTLIRQWSQASHQPRETIILRPASIASDQCTEVFSMAPDVYDGAVKRDGSYAKHLIKFGVIKAETEMAHEFQRDRSMLILHGPRDALVRFKNTL